jgi:hypothetical protein
MTLRMTSVAVVALTLPALAYSADTLNVKLGLWEITSVTETRGMPPLPKELLANMTPEQRRQMEAEIKAEQAKGPDRDTDRECITQKDLDRPFESSNAKECTQKNVTTTRTTQEVHIVCTGGIPGSGTLKVSAPSPEKMTGSLDLKLGEGAQAMTIKSQLQGRWIGSDCGDEADEDQDATDEDEGDDR